MNHVKDRLILFCNFVARRFLVREAAHWLPVTTPIPYPISKLRSVPVSPALH
jgi:hypothetical protein